MRNLGLLVTEGFTYDDDDDDDEETNLTPFSLLPTNFATKSLPLLLLCIIGFVVGWKEMEKTPMVQFYTVKIKFDRPN